MDEPKKRKGGPGLLTLIGVGMLLWILLGAGLPFLISGDPAERGQFGDMFGAANSLFSALAMAGVIYAIVLQRRELEMQREQMEATRRELRRQRAPEFLPLDKQAVARGRMYEFRNGGATIRDIRVTPSVGTAEFEPADLWKSQQLGTLKLYSVADAIGHTTMVASEDVRVTVSYTDYDGEQRSTTLKMDKGRMHFREAAL